jgi:hypothetical protein
VSPRVLLCARPAIGGAARVIEALLRRLPERGKPRNASPTTPSSGVSACAVLVIRPPKDFPPAMSGRPGHSVRARCTASPTRATQTGGESGRLFFCSM